MNRVHPIAVLVGGTGLLVAACIGTFYSVLAVGVSDGQGHRTAQFMLGACVLAALAALLLMWRSARALWARL